MAPLPPRPKLAFLASHNGSTMRAIVAMCRDGSLAADPALLISNNADSGAMAWAAEHALTAVHLSATGSGSSEALDQAMVDAWRKHRVDLVVMAGYMRKLGPRALAAYQHRILNVHPALLPKYGGQGMYGRFVHDAVLKSGERTTGVTIHLVDGEYDHGPIVAQAEVPVLDGDTAESLAARVQARERVLFPETLKKIVAGEIDLDRLAGVAG